MEPGIKWALSVNFFHGAPPQSKILPTPLLATSRASPAPSLRSQPLILGAGFSKPIPRHFIGISIGIHRNFNSGQNSEKKWSIRRILRTAVSVFDFTWIGIATEFYL